jgi:hypothetical protein
VPVYPDGKVEGVGRDWTIRENIMPEITARPYKYKEGDLVLANGERFGVVLEHQAGWVYKIRSGSEELFYVESQLEPADSSAGPGDRAFTGNVARR